MKSKINYTENMRGASIFHLNMNKKIYHLSAIIILTFSIVFSLFIANQIGNLFQKNDEIHVQNQFIFFQNNLDDFFQTSENIAIGYEAFYLSSEYVSTEEANNYLSHITKDFDDYLLSIGIIKDTTLIYNYPIEGIESYIGIDLTKKEEYKDYILSIKNNLRTEFIGPISLLQGGIGYSINIPLTNNNEYWGMAAIILDSEKINNKILDLASESQLDIAIYYDNNESSPFVGDPDILNKSPYKFEGSNKFNWVIYALSTSDITDYVFIKFILSIIGILSSFIITFMYLLDKKTSFNLKYSTTHDPLTDLYNRRYLEVVQDTITKEALKSNLGYGLLHIDIDNFKNINDSFGHTVGDNVLREISRVLKNISRKSDLVFRIGGDEFLIIIPFIQTKDDLIMMRERFESEFPNEFDYSICPDFDGISIGIALFSNDDHTFDDILKRADMNMYEVKKEHKSRQKKDL